MVFLFIDLTTGFLNAKNTQTVVASRYVVDINKRTSRISHLFKDQTLRTVFVGMVLVKRRLGSVMRIKLAKHYTNVKTSVVHVQV